MRLRGVRRGIFARRSIACPTVLVRIYDDEKIKHGALSKPWRRGVRLFASVRPAGDLEDLDGEGLA